MSLAPRTPAQRRWLIAAGACLLFFTVVLVAGLLIDRYVLREAGSFDVIGTLSLRGAVGCLLGIAIFSFTLSNLLRCLSPLPEEPAARVDLGARVSSMAIRRRMPSIEVHPRMPSVVTAE